MSRQFAYKRVSTSNQETVRQFHGVNISFDHVFEDKLSGKDVNRPELQACLQSLQEGDTLHVWETARLSRNLTDLRETVFALLKKGVSVKFHKDGLEFTPNDDNGIKTAMSKMQLNLMGTIAEFDRAMICERVREGVLVAKSKGVKFGTANEKYNRTDFTRRGASKNSKAFAEGLRSTLAAYRSVKTPFSHIAIKLNEQGKTTIRGNAFDTKAITRICQQLGIK